MNANIAVIKKPELVEVGTRAVSVHGWRYDLAGEHLKWHVAHKNKACSVECMARTMFSRNTPTNCDRVRKNIAPLFRKMLAAGMFVVIEYDHSPTGHGKIKACKIFDVESASEKDRQEAAFQLERMRKRRQVTEDAENRALAILKLA